MIHRIVRIVCVIARVFTDALAPYQALEEHTQPLVYFDTQDTGPAYIRMQNPLIQHSHSAAHVWWHGPWSTAQYNFMLTWTRSTRRSSVSQLFRGP